MGGLIAILPRLFYKCDGSATLKNSSWLVIHSCFYRISTTSWFCSGNKTKVWGVHEALVALSGIVWQRQTYAKNQVHVRQCATKIPILMIFVRWFVIPNWHWIFIWSAHIYRMTAVLQHHGTPSSSQRRTETHGNPFGIREFFLCLLRNDVYMVNLPHRNLALLGSMLLW